MTITVSNSKYTDYNLKHKRAFFSKFAFVSGNPDLKIKKKKKPDIVETSPHISAPT